VSIEPKTVASHTSIKPAVAWLAGLIAVGTLIRIPQLWHGLNEMHAFRQTQTTYVALEYARHGINLLHTPLPIFGPNSDVPMEFPLVQAVAALLIRIGVGPDMAMRIVGLVGFQVAAIVLFVLVLRWHGRLAAIVVLALFEFSPFGLAWGAAALIDFPAVALSLGMVVGMDAWFRSGSRIALASGALSAWLAFLVKATTPPAWCVLVVVSAAAAYVTARSWSRIITGFLAGPILGVAAGLGWARYADAVKSRNPLTHFLTSAGLSDWNFGTLGQRFDPGAYVPVLLRVGAEIAGPLWLGLVFAVLGIILAPTRVDRLRRAGWLGTAVAAPLLFFNLYHVHNYYLIGIFPAIVASVGIGIVAVAQRIRANTSLLAAAGTALILVGSAVRQDMSQWLTSPAPDPAVNGYAPRPTPVI
jgi:multisubunit Na+/H+ antiporter MnhF subunit